MNFVPRRFNVDVRIDQASEGADSPHLRLLTTIFETNAFRSHSACNMARK